MFYYLELEVILKTNDRKMLKTNKFPDSVGRDFDVWSECKGTKRRVVAGNTN